MHTRNATINSVKKRPNHWHQRQNINKMLLLFWSSVQTQDNGYCIATVTIQSSQKHRSHSTSLLNPNKWHNSKNRLNIRSTWRFDIYFMTKFSMKTKPSNRCRGTFLSSVAFVDIISAVFWFVHFISSRPTCWCSSSDCSIPQNLWGMRFIFDDCFFSSFRWRIWFRVRLSSSDRNWFRPLEWRSLRFSSMVVCESSRATTQSGECGRACVIHSTAAHSYANDPVRFGQCEKRWLSWAARAPGWHCHSTSNFHTQRSACIIHLSRSDTHKSGIPKWILSFVAWQRRRGSTHRAMTMARWTITIPLGQLTKVKCPPIFLFIYIFMEKMKENRDWNQWPRGSLHIFTAGRSAGQSLLLRVIKLNLSFYDNT